MIEPTLTTDAVSSNLPITTPPRVYYLPDAQGRMASYYNAIELPEQYTKNHGIPRTKFISVGYCCLEEIAPRPVSINYRGKNPRNDYRPPENVPPALLQSVEAKLEEKQVLMEPRAPPPSPEQQTVEEVAPLSQGRVNQGQQLVSVATSGQPSIVTPAPIITSGQPGHQLHSQTALPAAQPSSFSPTCTHGTSAPRVVSHHVPPPTTHVNHVTPSPLVTRMPAICRRWLIGTCRRGASCRNRHYVLDETDAELCRIKESHLATVRFCNESRAAEAEVAELRQSAAQKEEMRRDGQFVEAHVEGLGKTKIPTEALSGQLEGLKLRDEAEVTTKVASKESSSTGTVLISPAISATDSNLEPLPDYTLSMPPVRTGPTPVPRTSSHNQQIEPVHRVVPTVHPAERFRASYTPHHLSSLARQQSSPYSRRAIQQQDFVPRHVLDRALQQYIAGSLRGRRFLGPRPPSAKKRAILAQMSEKGVEVDFKVGSAQSGGKEKLEEKLISAEQVAPAVVGKEEAQNRAWSDEVEDQVVQEAKIATGDGKAAVAPALLVDIARV